MRRSVAWITGLLVLTVAVIVNGADEFPTGESILEKIDGNMASENRILTSRMVIHGRRGVRTITSRIWSEGETRAFTEYLSPAREKGTKMLKLEDMLWTYSPATDRTIRISGHMLRQSVMGSDLSYEDMLEDSRLLRHYEAVVTGTDAISNRSCWVLTLRAKTPSIAYQKRKLWVDRERFIPLREELFAKSGKLLKKLELSEVTRLEGRWFPRRMLFKDMLKKGKGTEFVVEHIRFDTEIPEHIFSKAALRK